MNVVKKMSLSFILLLLSLPICFSQSSVEQLDEEQKMEMKKNMEDFAKSLQLTEEQKPEFVAISEKYGQQMLELKDSNSSKWKKYRKVKSINKSRNKEMKKLLTEEQYQLYVKRQKELQKKMKERSKK